MSARVRMKKVLALLCLAALCPAQKTKKQKMLEWDETDNVQRTSPKGCSNLTVVLDNWKFAIMNQVKDLLLNDHSSILPEYGRIQSLSGALDNLYKDFKALKENLGTLTSKFDGVEAFVDDIQMGKVPSTVTRPVCSHPIPRMLRPQSSHSLTSHFMPAAPRAGQAQPLYRKDKSLIPMSLRSKDPSLFRSRYSSNSLVSFAPKAVERPLVHGTGRPLISSVKRTRQRHQGRVLVRKINRLKSPHV